MTGPIALRTRPALGPPTASRPAAVFTVTALGAFMASLDLSIVNVAFPALARSFPRVTPAGLAWVITAYSIVFGSLLVTAGRSADRYGRRRFFFLGLAVFCLGSALCGLAPAVAVLVAGRVIQAAGAACLLPASLGLLIGAFPPERRSQVVALWGGVGALAVATGPSLGAALISAGGWRWAFYVNLPVAALAWFWGRRILVESEIPSAPPAPDYLGVVVLSTGLACAVLAITEGPTWGWASGRVLAAFGAFGLLGGIFVFRSFRHPAPVLDLKLFRARTFSVANGATFVYAMGFFAMLLGNILFLTGVWHYSILAAGLAITPGPLVVAVVSGYTGRLAGRVGFRTVLVPGAACFALGLAWYVWRVGGSPEYVTRWLPGTLITGLGIGLTFPVLSAAAVASLPPEHLAVGGAVNQTARQIGGAVGVALLVVFVGSSGHLHHLANFRHLWTYCAAMAVLSGLAGTLLTRERALPAVVEDLAPELAAGAAGLPLALEASFE